MPRRFLGILGALAILALSTLAQAHDVTQGDLTIHEPWARATLGMSKTAAAYLTVENQGTHGDRLIGVSTPVADGAMLHVSAMENGVMKMRPLEAIDVPAGGEVALEPGGMHVMLMGVHKPLKEGAHFPLTLSFEHAGDVAVTVHVAGVAASAAEQDGEGQESHEMEMDQGHSDEAMSEEAASPTAVAQKAPQEVIDVKIENRQVVVPKEAIRVTEGEVVELRWTSDEAVELHLHGYDIEMEVKPGKPASMVVEANATGRFPIEVHRWGNQGHSEETLTFLEVYPK